jgi:membrane protein implicated in regulation of membrane protease activity
MDSWIIWLIAISVFAIIELFTGWLVFFSLAVGAVVALIATLLDLSLAAQLIALALVAAATYLIAIPTLHRHHRSSGQRAYNDSNIGALIGKTALLTQPIAPNTPGRLRLDGDCWQARSVDNGPIDAGETVEIVGYDSIVLIVERAVA